MSNEETFYARVPKINGNKEDDFHLWAIAVKAALCGKELYMVFSDDTADKNKMDRL